jgi:hypothetical protein
VKEEEKKEFLIESISGSENYSITKKSTEGAADVFQFI